MTNMARPLWETGVAEGSFNRHAPLANRREGRGRGGEWKRHRWVEEEEEEEKEEEEWNLHGRARTDFIVLSLTRFDRGQLTRETLIANFTLSCLPRTKQKMRYRRIFHGFRTRVQCKMLVQMSLRLSWWFHEIFKVRFKLVRMENFHADAIRIVSVLRRMEFLRLSWVDGIFMARVSFCVEWNF